MGVFEEMKENKKSTKKSFHEHFAGVWTANQSRSGCDELDFLMHTGQKRKFTPRLRQRQAMRDKNAEF